MESPMHAREDSHEFSKQRIPGCLQAPNPNPLFNTEYVQRDSGMEEVMSIFERPEGCALDTA